MSENDSIGLSEYNSFCKELRIGSILYNIDSTNLWGEYLLVAHITKIRVGNAHTYTALLIVLKKEEGQYAPLNLCISLTPDSAKNIPFLKQVGYCRFKLIPSFDSIDINAGLVAVYSQTDLHKFSQNVSIRKPKKRKYSKDGKLVVRKTGNK